SLRSKLELHLADKNASWSGDVARWIEDGHASLLCIASPLTAAAVVDAIVLGIPGSARVTLAYEGEASDVARRAAARLGVTLLDATAFPEPPAPIEIPPEVGAEMLAVAL